MNEAPHKVPVLKIDPNLKELEKYDHNNSIPADKKGNMIDFDTACYDKNDKKHKEQAESRKKTAIDHRYSKKVERA